MATSEVTSPTKTESPANIGPDNKDSVAKFNAPSARGAPSNRRGGGGGRGGTNTRGRGNNARGANKGRGGDGFRRGGNAQGDASRNPPSIAPSVAEGSVTSNFSRSTSGARFLEMDFGVRLRKNEGPTTNLPFVDTTEKPFNNRCRLYVGNLPSGTTEDEVKEIFGAYGTLKEVFVNTEKNFGFLRTETRALAEQARHELDGSMYKGRPLRVRFSFANSAVKVRNLNPFVTNELLEWGFQVFGEIERAVVICDERGKSTGEGIVEFSKRPSAVFALKKCTEGAYYLSRSLRPVIVEAYEPTDDSEGFPEKSLYRNSGEFYEERSVGPWFAEAGSFEAQYADRWKEHFLLFKEKFEALKFEQKVEQDKLVAKMDYARYENETERLRQQLLERESLREKQKQECEMLEKRAEDQKRLFEENLKKQEEERIQSFQRRRDGPAEPLNGGYRSRNNEAFNPFAGPEPFLDQRREFRESTDGTDGGNGHGGAPEPMPLMDAFDGRGRGGHDNRPRWSLPQGDRRGMPGGNDDGPHMKRRRF